MGPYEIGCGATPCLSHQRSRLLIIKDPPTIPHDDDEGEKTSSRHTDAERPLAAKKQYRQESNYDFGWLHVTRTEVALKKPKNQRTHSKAFRARNRRISRNLATRQSRRSMVAAVIAAAVAASSLDSSSTSSSMAFCNPIRNWERFPLLV